MSAIWMRARTELRSGWRAAVSLVLLIGIGGGAAIGAAAGANRTATAYDRYRAELRAHDATISSGQGPFPYAAEINALPGVESAGLTAAVQVNVHFPKPSPDSFAGRGYVSVGADYGYTIDRPKLLAGRLPDPGVPTEAVVNRFFSGEFGLSIGDTLKVRQVDPQANEEYGPALTIEVVGIGVYPNEVLPVTFFDRFPVFYLSPAFYRDVVDKARVPFYTDYVRLKPDADVERLNDAANRVAFAHGGTAPVFFSSEEDRIGRIRRALAPLATALWVFAGVAGLAFLVVVGQLMARQLSLEASEYPRLRSLGMTPRQTLAIALVKSGALAVAGGLLATGVAIGVSPLFPIGPARLAEPRPGVGINVAILGLGFGAIVVLLVLAVLGPASRAASVPASWVLGVGETLGARRPSRLARTAAAAGLPVPVVAGVRMALESGRGRTAVPVRSAVVATVVAISALGVTYVFGASLDRLVSTPEMYGQRWDQLYDATFGGISLAGLERAPDVEALAGGYYTFMRIDGRGVSGVGLDGIKGDAVPTVLEGRAPVRPDEIALGTRTLRALGRAIGDTVTAEFEGVERRPMRIVGRAVFPRFGQGIFLPTGLGDGALVTADVIPFLDSPAPPPGVYGFALVRYRPDAAARPTEVELGRRCDEVNRGGSLCFRDDAQVPADVSTYQEVHMLPLGLAALLALIAAAAVGHALVTAVQRRKRDFAILKSVGFIRRQVRSAVGWQATTAAAVSLLIACPLGVAGGRWAWSAFARFVGVDPSPKVPALGLLIVPATVLLANVIAALPARVAARTQPALILRAE